MIWTRAVVGHTQVPGPVEVLALLAAIFAVRLARSEHEGWSFHVFRARVKAPPKREPGPEPATPQAG